MEVKHQTEFELLLAMCGKTKSAAQMPEEK